MIKIIIGKKGSGKTKLLADMVNTAADTSLGNVVCIEKSDALIYSIKYKARLIDTEEYFITDAQSLYGFVAGILASNHDVTDLFIDSALKICQNDAVAFDIFVEEMAKLSDKVGINIVMTSSIPVEEATDTVNKYL